MAECLATRGELFFVLTPVLKVLVLVVVVGLGAIVTWFVGSIFASLKCGGAR